MRIRHNYQISCPVCAAGVGRPCKGKIGERLQGVHFQRATALRRAQMEVLHGLLYAPLPISTAPAGEGSSAIR